MTWFIFLFRFSLNAKTFPILFMTLNTAWKSMQIGSSLAGCKVIILNPGACTKRTLERFYKQDCDVKCKQCRRYGVMFRRISDVKRVYKIVLFWCLLFLPYVFTTVLT